MHEMKTKDTHQLQQLVRSLKVEINRPNTPAERIATLQRYRLEAKTELNTRYGIQGAGTSSALRNAILFGGQWLTPVLTLENAQTEEQAQSLAQRVIWGDQ